MVRHPFGWSDNYAVCEPFSLWGSTVVVVSSISLGYTDQDCGDHRFDAATPSPLHFDTHDFAPKDRATQTDRQLYGSLAIQGCSRRDRVLIASAGSTRFNDMLGSVYVVLSLYRGVPAGAGP